MDKRKWQAGEDYLIKKNRNGVNRRTGAKMNGAMVEYTNHLETLRQITGTLSEGSDFLTKINPDTGTYDFNEIRGLNYFNGGTSRGC